MEAAACPFPFIEASTEFQRHLGDGTTFPLILTPAEDSREAKDVAALADAVQLQRDWIDSQLVKHGAVLLRGFPVSSAEDFNTVMEAFGWEEFEYIRGGGLASRTRICGRVLSVNENIPLDQYIGFHNEATYLEKPPTRLVFFCEKPPPDGAGGNTPLLLGHSVYQRVPELSKELVNITMLNILSEEQWKKRFETDDKQVAEEKIFKSDGVKPEWMENGGVKLPFTAFGGNLFREDRGGRMALYGSLGFMVNAFEVELRFADGTKVPQETIDDLVKIMREEEVSFPWEKGDVVILDNSAVQHSRQRCTSTTTTRVMRLSLVV